RWGRAEPAAVSGSVELAGLRALAQRFLPAERVDGLIAGSGDVSHASIQQVAAVEHELAAVIGASSAHLLVDVVRHRRRDELEVVAAIVGEASQDLRFNQRVLEAALENMSQGICVVDAQLCVVAWNRRYSQLFDYPEGMLTVGRPIADLTRHNIERGVIGGGEIEQRLQRRLTAMRSGTPHLSERKFPDGSIIEIRGNPMPGGGFVATFTDVTAFRQTEHELTRANENLEQRVDERTAELAQASAVAESANLAKSRFLAAVGHDLAQPLNAAHLFTHALSDQLRHPQYREAVARIDSALVSAEDLLGGLLAISRLDAGGMRVQCESFRIDHAMQSLAAEFGLLAQQKGLQLRCRTLPVWIVSDMQLLRRILQNFLSNAAHYTRTGGILLACRRQGDDVSIEVWDTGVGIDAADRATIFEEFKRLQRDGHGLGLGLSIADRLARLLGHRLSLRSRPGRGSVFAIRVPIGTAAAAAPAASNDSIAMVPRHSRVLVVDNEASVRDAMQALLRGWHCDVQIAADTEAALRAVRAAAPDILLLDYHLDADTTGLDVYRRLCEEIGERPCAIVSADHSQALRDRVAAAGCQLLHKPVKPLALKSMLAHLQARRNAGDEFC
ncbi:MAG: NahK/ErcS family hybrid sensor histidine kinase/response regulator, partial [Rudaea sp.]